jgi:hypothetical protein
MRRHPSYHYGPDNPHHLVRHGAGMKGTTNNIRDPHPLKPWLWDQLTPAGFLALTSCGTFVLFGLVWLWVLVMPLAFLDPEYPSWLAKQTLLANCDVGDTVILGDSRAATAMMPVGWQSRATNLAVGGGEPVEAFATLSRAMRCPVSPNRVILSFDAVHFTQPDLFWERTVRFGFVNAGEVATLRMASLALGDQSIYEPRHTDGLPSWLRDTMYRVRFPSLYFTSLMKSGLVLRWSHNDGILRAGIASRGQYFFGAASGSHTIAAEGHLRVFQPLPVLAWYFNQILEQLDAHGIPAVFIAVPMNEATARQVLPDVRFAFRAWLGEYEARYRGFRVAGDVMPYWPDSYFGDGFAHLNPGGATLFSDRLGRCLDAGILTEACIQRLQAAPAQTRSDAQ